MARRFGSVVAAFAAIGAFALPTIGAADEVCGQPVLTESGNYFTDYELIERSPDGFLIYHFRNNFAVGDSFTLRWNFQDDECSNYTGASNTVSLPVGVTDWSLRFASPTRLEMWDDHNNLILRDFGIPEYPGYTRISFTGIKTAANPTNFNSRSELININGAPPPIVENQVEKSESCPPIAATGNRFDSYERAEYVDGLLRVHLRFKQFSGGVTYSGGAVIRDTDCANPQNAEPFTPNGITIPRQIRYYSYRMTSPTAWVLWDDEHDEQIMCAKCSGTIPAGTPYVSWFSNIGDAFSTLHTTPFPPTLDTSPDPVIIIPGILGSEQVSGVWIIDPILHVYDDLIATLDANGYTPEEDLFTFPYNWRKSNIETAVLLKQKINSVKAICECDKVDLVAHSMGGLVARQYIQSDAYEQDVDQLIFLGTPHLGAPKAYLMWEGGEIGVGFQNWVLHRMLSQEAEEQGYPDLFSYVRTEPIESVRELLPIYNYLQENEIQRQYPLDYPRNEFLETLNANTHILLGSGVSLSNIAGNTDTNVTITGLSVTDDHEFKPQWIHGYPINYYADKKSNGLILGVGDETVPDVSANYITQVPRTIDSVHFALPDIAKGELFEILTGKQAAQLIDNWNIPNLKMILVQMFSPADMLIIDPSGRKVGKENGMSMNEIPGAFYSGFNTNTEYITILNPIDGEYKIITEGTGDGSYTVETTYIDESESITDSFTGNTQPGLVSELEVVFSNTNPNELDISPTDTDPPVITIVQPESKDYQRPEMLNIDVSADDPSGVAVLETVIGTTSVTNTGTVDLFFYKLGDHVLTASSTDNVANATSTTVEFRVIATPESTLSDIERTYTLGWIDRKTRDQLKKKLDAAIKISKVVEKKTDGRPRGEKVHKVVDKILLGAMLIELQKLKKKGLEDRAYRLIVEDIHWMIRN